MVTKLVQVCRRLSLDQNELRPEAGNKCLENLNGDLAVVQHQAASSVEQPHHRPAQVLLSLLEKPHVVQAEDQSCAIRPHEI